MEAPNILDILTARNVSVVTDEYTIELTYSGHRISVGHMLRLLDAIEKDGTVSPIEVGIKMLPHIIMEWSLMDGKKMLPVTFENLSAMPYSVVLLMVTVIFNDYNNRHKALMERNGIKTDKDDA